MTFFDPLKPDRPEFDAIEQDMSKTLVWSPPPIGVEDFVFPPAPPHGPSGGTRVKKLPKITRRPNASNLINDNLLDSERQCDERKAKWWRRLWSG